MTYADGNAQSVGSTFGQRNARSAGVEVADLTHHDIRDRLSDLLDQALDDTEQARVVRHLAACPSCTAYLRTLRRTVDLLGTLPSQPISERLRARLHAIPAEEATD